MCLPAMVSSVAFPEFYTNSHPAHPRETFVTMLGGTLKGAGAGECRLLLQRDVWYGGLIFVSYKEMSHHYP